MAKHVGIVACSAEGAALCYRTLCIEGSGIMGRHAHPEVTMHTFPLNEYMKYIVPGDWEKVGELMLASLKIVASAGAEFAICPDNTIHEAFPHIINKSPIPWLHIAEEVAIEAESRDYKCTGILGTKFLMEGPVYPEKLKHYNINYKIPDKAAREKINNIIFAELVYGKFYKETRDYFHEIINKLGEAGCDSVILGCTEIPLLVDPHDSPLPALDSTRILARGALKKATTITI